MTLGELGATSFLQMFVIIGVCRGVAWLVRRYLGQPHVVGEMIAGLVLGPSLLGFLAPELQQLLFPEESKAGLYRVAQLGLGIYMFLVGLGFQADHLRHNTRSAVAISLSGVAVPFLAAIGMTPWILSLGLFGYGIDSIQASLFLGAAISITAFPVLARILTERGLSETALGTLSLSTGAVSDAAAWIVLAVVLARLGDSPIPAIKAIVGGGLFVVIVVALGPKLLAPLGAMAEREGVVSPGMLCIAVMLLMLCAWATETAGLHAVFGCFIFGAVMPRGVLASEIKRQLEPFVSALLLPIFFAFSGLNTQLTMVNSLDLVLVASIVLAISILTKGGACWGAARMMGQDNATALGIGALMNARGLIELIILNIGLEKGIIGSALFSVLVLMAIVTTLMALPLFELVYGRKPREHGRLGDLSEAAEEGRTIIDARAR